MGIELKSQTVRRVSPCAIRNWLVRLAAFALCLGYPFWIATVPVLAVPVEDEPITGCGKAEALKRRYIAEQVRGEWQTEYERQRAAGLREALEDTDLLHCNLEIEVLPDSDTNLIGSNTMTIQSKSNALTQFTFRLREQYAITSATMNGATPVTITQLSATTRVAALDRIYGMDEVFTLTIAYSGHAESRGFGSIGFTTHGGSDIVYSLSEPYFSYTWWPVKDGDFGVPGDNSDKFTLELAVIAPSTMSTVSNGLLQGIDSLSGGRSRYRWASDYPICPYLVCFSSTNYNAWSRTYTTGAGGTMPVEFRIYPEHDTPANRAAWESCVDMLTRFRPLYGEYPFVDEKYGIYECNFGGGMEHQTFTAQGTFSEWVTAHELSHQWWGDMITCKTWSDIWLNEGFATHGECLWEEFKTGTSNPAAYFACIQGRRPSAVDDSVYVYPAQTANLNRIFSGTYSYRKGAWVLHQLRYLVGDTAFFGTLANYRVAYEYSAATTDDFAAVASATYGQDLSWFFDQWVYQIGAPAYQYGWQSASVAGQDYLLVKIDQTQVAAYPDVFTMPVDLVATIGGAPQTVQVWNDARNEWFVVPVDGPVTALQFDPNQWILRTGAVNLAYAPGPPKIVATSPSPGAFVEAGAGADQISITFHTNVNAPAAAFSLVGVNSGARSFTVSSSTNVNPVVLVLEAPLPPDAYTLTVTSGVTAVNSGMALDGEVADAGDAGSLPSGDGVPGGDATIEFTVLATPPTVPAVGPAGLRTVLLLLAVCGGIVWSRRQGSGIGTRKRHGVA
jgi:hypothetical protein